MSIKLKHPDSKHVVEVRDEDAAGIYRTQGWSESGKAEDPTPQVVKASDSK